MNEEERLDELLEIEEENFNRDIKKKINKTIYSKILLVLCVCVCFLIALLNIKRYNDHKAQTDLEAYEASQNYYNPYDKPHTGNGYLFSTLMETSIEMRFPGVSCYDGDYTINNPAKYTYVYRTHLQKITKAMVVSVGASNLEITVDRSKIVSISDDDDLLTYYQDLFKSPTQTITEYNYFPKITEDDIQEIKELPDSCVLDVAISFNQPKKTSEIVTLVQHYPRSLFTWLATDSTKRNGAFHYGIADGINIYHNSVSDFELELTKQYPDLYFDPDDISKEAIENCYLSQCQFLLDNEDFLNIKGNFFTKEQIEQKLSQAKSMVEQNGEMAFIGIYGTIKKDDLLDLIERENIVYGSVQDVKLSILQK